jgi:hypothetical protein
LIGFGVYFRAAGLRYKRGNPAVSVATRWLTSKDLNVYLIQASASVARRQFEKGHAQITNFCMSFVTPLNGPAQAQMRINIRHNS